MTLMLVFTQKLSPQAVMSGGNGEKGGGGGCVLKC